MTDSKVGRAYRLAQLEKLIDTMADGGDVWFASLGQVARHAAPELFRVAR